MIETMFTGATVGPQGVQPDLEKLTAIVNWERPADALNLESFLMERWEAKYTTAHLDLKVALVSRPILQAPQYDRSNFIVTSDGCQEGLVAVLSQ